jgi:hypothetical protein
MKSTITINQKNGSSVSINIIEISIVIFIAILITFFSPYIFNKLFPLKPIDSVNEIDHIETGITKLKILLIESSSDEEKIILEKIIAKEEEVLEIISKKYYIEKFELEPLFSEYFKLTE